MKILDAENTIEDLLNDLAQKVATHIYMEQLRKIDEEGADPLEVMCTDGCRSAIQLGDHYGHVIKARIWQAYSTMSDKYFADKPLSEEQVS